MSAPVSDATSLRQAGRPRVFADESIFAAVHLVIRRDGYENLTLERVAAEVGCTRQALVRRFGSKRALLLAAVSASSNQITDNFNRSREHFDSPLAGLRHRMVEPPNSRPYEATDVRFQANLLAFILTSSTEADFADLFQERLSISVHEIERFLDDAVAIGELTPVDTPSLAVVLQAAWTGTTLSASANLDVDQRDMRSAIFDQIVGPYRRTRSS